MCTSEGFTNVLSSTWVWLVGVSGGMRGAGVWVLASELADPRQIRSPSRDPNRTPIVASFGRSRHFMRPQGGDGRVRLFRHESATQPARAPRGPRRRARHHPNQIKGPNSYHRPSIHGQPASTEEQTDGRWAPGRKSFDLWTGQRPPEPPAARRVRRRDLGSIAAQAQARHDATCEPNFLGPIQ